MPQFNDDIYVGGARVLIPPDPANSSPMDTGVGPLGRIYVWDAVPVAPLANNIALAQAPAGPGNLVLTPGVGVTRRLAQDGFSGLLVLDVPRNVVIAATTGGAPFTIYGFDQYGQPMTETLAAAGAGKKAFKSVARVSAGAAGTVITVGTGNVLGFPWALKDLGYIVSQKFAGVADAAVPLLADATAATATTGDVRGTIVPSSAPDGVKRLVIVIAMAAIQAGPNATRLGAVGVPQA